MGERVLEVDGISKLFPTPTGPLRVLDGVSLTMRAGERLAVMGPSGSGKSTLLAILGALEEPSSGSVRLDGHDPFALSADARAAFRNRHVGFIFQDHHLLGGLTALDNVVLPALATAGVTPATEARAHGLLERVGLAGRSRHLPAQLSGGERQRVAVARALLLSPRLILADEPTGQLDATTAGGIADLLVTLAEDSGAILVVVTHADAVARRVGTVRHLADGRLSP